MAPTVVGSRFQSSSEFPIFVVVMRAMYVGVGGSGGVGA